LPTVVDDWPRLDFFCGAGPAAWNDDESESGLPLRARRRGVRQCRSFAKVDGRALESSLSNATLEAERKAATHLAKCRCLLWASFLVQGETMWSVGDWNDDWLSRVGPSRGGARRDEAGATRRRGLMDEGVGAA